MSEFQKRLSQPKISQPAQLQMSGNSLVGDIAQGASFLLDVYQRGKQIDQAEAFQTKQKESQDTLDRLIGLESSLTAQGLSQFQINERLRKEVEFLPTSEDRNAIRGALAKFRGTTLVAEQQALTKTDEEIRTENIENMYQDLERVAPSFALLYNTENTLESKEAAVNLWREQTIKAQAATKQKEDALNMANTNAVAASDMFSDAMHTEIALNLNNGFNSFVQALETINPSDKEGIAQLQEMKRGVFETANTLKADILRQYSVMSRGIPPEGDSKIYMDAQRDALIAQIDNISELMQQSEYVELKTFTNQLKGLETQYQLDALQSGDFVAKMNAKYGQLVTNTLSQRVLTQDLELGEQFREGVTSSLKSLTGATGLTERVDSIENITQGRPQTFERDTQAYSDLMKTLRDNNVSSMEDKTQDAIFTSTTNYLKSATTQTNITNPMELIKQVSSPKFRALFANQDKVKQQEFAVAARDYTLRAINDIKQGMGGDLERSMFGGKVSVEDGRLKITPTRTLTRGAGISLEDTRFLQGSEIVNNLNYLLDSDIIKLEDVSLLVEEGLVDSELTPTGKIEIEKDYSSFPDGTYVEDGEKIIIQNGVRIDG